MLAEGESVLAGQFPTEAFLPDGISKVTGVFAEQSNELTMLDAGFGTKRSATFAVLASEFAGVQQPPLEVNAQFTIAEKPWRVDAAPRNGSIIDYRLVQAW
jgi:hypothetical protein